MIIALFGACGWFSARAPGQTPGRMPEWDDPKYLAANTAQTENYLREKEKQVYYYLNLARMNPALFADTYLGDLNNSSNSYEKGLIRELKKMKPVGPLYPKRDLFEWAKCHAIESGESGYVGHGRARCEAGFLAECISYGVEDPLGIVVQLLVDKGVPSLGHRRTCLDTYYNALGVSIQPHKGYRVNTVLDFGKAWYETSRGPGGKLLVRELVAPEEQFMAFFNSGDAEVRLGYNFYETPRAVADTRQLTDSLDERQVNYVESKYFFRGGEISPATLRSVISSESQYHHPRPFIRYHISEVKDGTRTVIIIQGHCR